MYPFSQQFKVPNYYFLITYVTFLNKSHLDSSLELVAE